MHEGSTISLVHNHAWAPGYLGGRWPSAGGRDAAVPDAMVSSSSLWGGGRVLGGCWMLGGGWMNGGAG